MESSFLIRDKALSLQNRGTDSKTLGHQRTNPREYQIVRTHTKEITWIQDPASPNHQLHPVQEASSKHQTKQKYKPSHQHTGVSPHSALPIRGETNKQSSAQISPYTAAAAAAKSLQSCLTLCNPTGRSLQGSSIPRILQARTLEWVAISFSNAWKWKVKVK